VVADMPVSGLASEGGWKRVPKRPEREVAVPRSKVESVRSLAAEGARQQKSWYLTREVIARANSCVYWCLPKALAAADRTGVEPDLSQVPDSASALVENALWAEVLRLEALYNGGEPFPDAPSRLRTGPGQAGIERLSRPRPPAAPETEAGTSTSSPSRSTTHGDDDSEGHDGR